MTDLINQLMNHEAVYRTAPATPGLLKTESKNSRTLCFFTPFPPMSWTLFFSEH